MTTYGDIMKSRSVTVVTACTEACGGWMAQDGRAYIVMETGENRTRAGD